MGPTAGIMAGLVVIGAAVTFYRLASRKADDLRRAIDEIRGAPNAGKNHGSVIDFEKDPETGVYRRRG